MNRQCHKCNSNSMSSPSGIGIMICNNCGDEFCFVPPDMPFNIAHSTIQAWNSHNDLNQFLDSDEYRIFLTEAKNYGFDTFIYPDEYDGLENQTNFPEALELITNAYNKYKDTTI